MAEEEVLMEVEAVQAVYGDDCVVLDSFPPHLHVHIKPRTADISSQQFVEAIIGIQAGPQYPEEPPHIDIIESKGLDEQRKKHLITSIRDRACELLSCSMLVTLCEEAVEKLSDMNYPDGNCTLCFHPLVLEDEQDESLPFMKLMSCFHCFHSECIVRWWNWLQREKKKNTNSSSSRALRSTKDGGNQNDMLGIMGNCPVCRKVFHAKDLKHVLGLVGAHSSELSSVGIELEKLLQSDSENVRRQKFEAILKLQQENSGLIEQKTNTTILLPGMYVPEPVTLRSTQASNQETTDDQQRDFNVRNSGCSSSRPSSSENRMTRRWFVIDDGASN